MDKLIRRIQVRGLLLKERTSSFLESFINYLLQSFPALKYRELRTQAMDQKVIVLVTGANTGLGFEIVKGLCSSETAYVTLIGGRSVEKAEQAANAVINEFPSSRSEVWPIQIDIEDDESIQHAFDEVQTKYGKLDVLVNNAGMSALMYHEQNSL